MIRNSRPSLIHGDVWSGTCSPSDDLSPFLDPAIYLAADPEIEPAWPYLSSSTLRPALFLSATLSYAI